MVLYSYCFFMAPSTTPRHGRASYRGTDVLVTVIVVVIGFNSVSFIAPAGKNIMCVCVCVYCTSLISYCCSVDAGSRCTSTQNGCIIVSFRYLFQFARESIGSAFLLCPDRYTLERNAVYIYISIIYIYMHVSHATE